MFVLFSSIYEGLDWIQFTFQLTIALGAVRVAVKGNTFYTTNPHQKRGINNK